MPNYKISPWPFKKDEMVTLYWIFSPVTEENGVRNMNVHFKTDKEFRTIKCPWGHLPLLQIGSKYKNGRITTEQNNLDTFSISYNYIFGSDVCTCFSIPKEMYPLVPAGVNAKELCYRFKYNSNTYYIPCVEIVRCLYASIPFYCEILLSTEDLDDFADITYTDTYDISISFYNNFPLSLFSYSNITEFLWFTQVDTIRKAREEIRTKYVKDKLIYSKLPNIINSRIVGKGIKHNNTVLLLNINVENIRLPFKNILSAHPAYVNSIASSNGNIKRTDNSIEDVIIVGDSTKSAKKTSPLVIGDIKSSKKFSSKINIEKVKRDAVTRKSIDNKEKNENKIIFTTQPNSLGAKAQPVTFNTTDIIDNISKPEHGFEAFCKAIRTLQDTFNFTVIDIKYINLCGNTIFVQTSNGSIRQCAIARIQYNSKTYTIIEANIEDGWSLSTLIFTHENDDNKMCKKIIDDLTENNGHWNSIWLNSLLKDKYTTIRHFNNRTTFQWSYLFSKAIEKIDSKLI